MEDRLLLYYNSIEDLYELGGIMRFRRKPVEVKAFQYGVDEVPQWAKEAKAKGIFMPYSQFGGTEIWCEIKTLEGTMVGNYKDYIIQGVQGEIYPCKPDIFELTYERVL